MKTTNAPAIENDATSVMTPFSFQNNPRFWRARIFMMSSTDPIVAIRITPPKAIRAWFENTTPSRR